MSTTVTYKGATLTTVDNDTVTLETAGKYCEDDFTLTDVSGGGVQTVLVSDITASGILYYTDANMTVKSGTFIQNEYLPIGSLIFVYDDGPAAPLMPTGAEWVTGYTAKLEMFTIYKVTG